MLSFLKKAFGGKPKSLPQLIEDNFDKVVMSTLQKSENEQEQRKQKTRNTSYTTAVMANAAAKQVDQQVQKCQ